MLSSEPKPHVVSDSSSDIAYDDSLAGTFGGPIAATIGCADFSDDESFCAADVSNSCANRATNVGVAHGVSNEPDAFSKPAADIADGDTIDISDAASIHVCWIILGGIRTLLVLHTSHL